MKLVPAIAIAASSAFLCGQAPPAFSSAVTTALDGFRRGAHFEAHEALFAAAFAVDGQVSDPIALQIFTQFSPLLTNELDPKLMAWRGSPTTPDPTWAKRISVSVPRDAIAEIVARARKTNIVILNEAHNSPRDRAFALRVAKALRPLGYKTLAAETFDNNQSETGISRTDQLKRDGFVRFNTGSYTIDPVFARFVREALAIGYEPVAYEQTKAQDRPGSGIPEREQAQAENLMGKIFSTRPREKTLIFVGHGHVAENPGKRLEMMATRLKRMSGVDPLTIDQTNVTDLSSPAREAYAIAAARIGRSSTVFFERANPLVIGTLAGSVDLQVIHPRRAYVSGRPEWLAALGGKRMLIPQRLMPVKGRRLIQVFAANAPNDAVPLDQVLVSAGAARPVLFVPAGPVRFAMQQ